MKIARPWLKLSMTPVVLSAMFVVVTACNKKAPTAPNYADAINSYYQAHPSCLWSEPKQFPVQVGASDDTETGRYNALVDQGLLTRTTSEKKIIIISKRQINYDLSAKGRTSWVADPSQPGYGNLCYGHRKVAAMDANSPTSDQPGATVQVSYHYTLADLADWASAAETQTAFPQLQAASSPQAATATLTNTSQGWQVSSTNHN